MLIRSAARVVSVPTFLADQSRLDQIAAGFDILGYPQIYGEPRSTQRSAHQFHYDLDNGQIGLSVRQLTTDATAVGKLENANASPMQLAISDTAAKVEAGLATLVADTGEIALINASDGPVVVVSASTFLADQSTLDKIVGGFAISDTAADVAQDLDALNADTDVTSIVLTNGGTPALTLTIEEALNDMLAQSEIASPHTTVIDDSAAATITYAQVLYLSGEDISVIGAPVIATGTVAKMAALDKAEASTLVGQGYTLAVLDTAADIRAMTVAQITALSVRDVTQVDASNTSVSLRVAQISSLEAGGIVVSAPAGDAAQIADTAANLETLTTSHIDGLAGIGVTGLVSTNANVSYTSAQTAAILSNGLDVSASGSYTVTENFANGDYSVYRGGQLIRQKSVNSDGSYDIAYFDVTGKPYSSYEAIYNSAGTYVVTALNSVNGAGNLLVYASGYTMTSAAGSESITIGSDTFALAAHSIETTTIENSKSNETFVYGAGFGEDTVAGFLAKTSSNDLLQFSDTMFGFSSTSSQTADAQALLSNFASGTTNTTITDQQGDSLTLNGVTIATLKANLGDFKFT